MKQTTELERLREIRAQAKRELRAIADRREAEQMAKERLQLEEKLAAKRAASDEKTDG